jgi:hypothetical protein
MYSMSSSPQNEVLTSEPLPCPECGALQMTKMIADCRLNDGVVVKRLQHFKCRACGATLFDDEAMHKIQAQRARHPVVLAV